VCERLKVSAVKQGQDSKAGRGRGETKEPWLDKEDVCLVEGG